MYQDSQNKGNNQHQQGGQTHYGNNQSGGDFGVTGGAHLNRPAGAMSGAQYGQDLDGDGIIDTADNDSGSSGERGLFGQALSFLKSDRTEVKDDIDEDDVVQKHNVAYGQGNAGNLDANGIGAAAAMQALKRFTQGGQPAQTSGGQSALIGMALSEASKLFDKSGGAAGGQKQDAVNSAGLTIMKLIMKSQMSGAFGAGPATAGTSSGGGLGQLMGMASKFM